MVKTLKTIAILKIYKHKIITFRYRNYVMVAAFFFVSMLCQLYPLDFHLHTFGVGLLNVALSPSNHAAALVLPVLSLCSYSC